MKAKVIAMVGGAGLAIAVATVYVVKAAAPGLRAVEKGMTQKAVCEILGKPPFEATSCLERDFGGWLYTKEVGFGPIVFGSRSTIVTFQRGIVTDKSEDFTRNLHWNWKRKWVTRKS